MMPTLWFAANEFKLFCTGLYAVHGPSIPFPLLFSLVKFMQDLAESSTQTTHIIKLSYQSNLMILLAVLLFRINVVEAVETGLLWICVGGLLRSSPSLAYLLGLNILMRRVPRLIASSPGSARGSNYLPLALHKFIMIFSVGKV